jgi:hypothetical protein
MIRKFVRSRRAVAGFGLLVGFVGVVAAIGAAVLRPEPFVYELTATQACLSEVAQVRTIQQGKGYWVFPALNVHFAGMKSADDWALYFASSVGEAKDNEIPDSYAMLRRRNVLSDRIAEFSRWDRRILGCLRAR